MLGNCFADFPDCFIMSFNFESVNVLLSTG
jgi:hypothetical protein